MQVLKNIIKILIILVFSTKSIFAEDIPVIVISPGKTTQSLNTVGSSVEIFSSETIDSSSHFSLAKVIDNNSTSTNLFQMGGHGANVGIQLRGLEKRYSTVYIDGVKMLDPSSSDGSFYLENIMKNGIERVEILKGTQSSLYGSNAIGGAINIFTKQGREGRHSNFKIETESKNTKNILYSVDGANDKFNYYLGLNKFLTDGISAMNDNDEKDQYKNDNVVANIGYKINENFKIQNSFRIADTFYEYDAVDKSYTDLNDSTDNLEASYSLKLIHEKNKFKNTLSYNKLQIERATTDYANKKVNYFGYRDAFNFLGEYNLNLDNKIIYGIDGEFDASRYPKDWSGGEMRKHNEGIISQYFDLQLRPLEKLYSTFGLRSDSHTTVGRKTSGRLTTAYLLNGNSKIRSSFGAGVRFPAMYDYIYGSSTIVDKGGTLEELQSERGLSFDLGYDTFLDNLDLGLNITYFKTEQKNPLFSNARTEWVVRNGTGRNTSEGVEFNADWKPTNSKFGLNLGYTFTDSYDANTCDPDELAAYDDNECRLTGTAVAKAKVRVPRHAVETNFIYSLVPNLKSSLRGKYISETRDFGNTNDNWTDQILSDYFVFDLINSYNYFDNYKIQLGINNIFDENFEQAHEYSTMGRTFNFGITKVY
jgi:vitamin B12 transporter